MRRTLLVLAVVLVGCGGETGGNGGGAGGSSGGGSGGSGGAAGGGVGGSGGAGGSVGGGAGGAGGGSAGGGSAGGVGGSGGGTAGAAGGGTASGTELNPGWIGGACTDPSSCSAPGYTATANCLTSGFPNGFCSQACTLNASSTYVCPDAASVGGTSGNTITRCISGNGSPTCAAECDFTQSATGCRPGYACVLRQRYGQASKIFKVCVPEPDQRWPGEAAPANDIGLACAGDSSCAQNSCLAMPGGYCTKTMCDFTGCPTGSTCFGTGNGQTACLKDCTAAGQCRTGENYVCDATNNICLPGTTAAPAWDNTVGAADCAAAWGTAGSGLSPCDTVKDHYMVVHKSKRNVALCNAGALMGNYQVGLGFAPVGDKVQEGDGKTPEGVFYVASLVPNSSYYKAFLVSYPDAADAARGFTAGLITSAEQTAINNAQAACTVPPQTTALGSYVEVHGMGGTSDWTLGCMALDNTSVDALWAAMGLHDSIVVIP